MIRPWIVAIVALVLTGTARASWAQEPSTSGLTQYHEALAQFAGVWQATATVDAEMIMGGRFLFENIRAEMGGRLVHGMVVVGYSTAASEYQAMKFDNNSTEMTRATGVLTEAGGIEFHNKITDPASGETVSRRTVLRLISEDEWLETVYETREGVERLVREIRAQRIR